MTKWISVKNSTIPPKPDTNYFVTVKKNVYSDERVVTIGSFNYDPFKKKYDWLHGDMMIAFAELPKPYTGE